MVCDWWLVACDRNYDWPQRKTQLWRRLMNLRVRMFVKGAVQKKKKRWNEWPYRLLLLLPSQESQAPGCFVRFSYVPSTPSQRKLWHLTCPPWAESNQQYRYCFELLDDSVISLFLTGFASISSISTFNSPLATFTSVKQSFTIRSTTHTSGPVRFLLRTTSDNKFLYQGLRSGIP